MTTAERILRLCREWPKGKRITIERIRKYLNVSDDPDMSYTEILGALTILVDESSIDIAYDGIITLTVAGEE